MCFRRGFQGQIEEEFEFWFLLKGERERERERERTQQGRRSKATNIDLWCVFVFESCFKWPKLNKTTSRNNNKSGIMFDIEFFRELFFSFQHILFYFSLSFLFDCREDDTGEESTTKNEILIKQTKQFYPSKTKQKENTCQQK